MLHRQTKTPFQRIGVRLSSHERTFLLETLHVAENSCTEAIRQTPDDQPIRLTPDELDQLVDDLAVQLAHTDDRATAGRLERLCTRPKCCWTSTRINGAGKGLRGYGTRNR